MPFGELFGGYEAEIRALFETLAREMRLTDQRAPTLEFKEEKTSMLFRSVPSERRVIADWGGIASLWAMSQAMGRLGPAMFDARRNGAIKLDLSDGSPEALGYDFIGYAKELCDPPSASGMRISQNQIEEPAARLPKRETSSFFALSSGYFGTSLPTWRVIILILRGQRS